MRPRSSFRRSYGALVIAVSVALLSPDALAAKPKCEQTSRDEGEWRFFGHDLANSRHQEDGNAGIDPGSVGSLAPVWAFSVARSGGTGDITGTPIVAGGCVYIATNGGWAFGLNADSGEVVWKAQLSPAEGPLAGGVNSTVAVEGNLVYAHVNRVGTPYLVALHRLTGDIAWETTLSTQEDSALWSSPVPFDGMIFSGLSGSAHGGFTLVNARTGELVKRGWSIPPDLWDQDYAGGSIVGTAAIDPDTGYAYVGTGSAPDSWQRPAHPNVDALIKIDVDRSSQTFGTVVASYRGVSEVFPIVVPESTLHGSPNIFRDSSGRKLVGAFHKNGLYYAVDADTMEPIYTGVGGTYFPLGGSSTAYDGHAIFGSSPTPGHVYSMDKDTGLLNWLSPTADAAHIAQPPALAEGVMYTVDTKGFLDAYDTATGAPLLHRPLALGAETGTDPILTLGSGVSVARETVYAAVGTSFGDVGYVIALRPQI